MMALQNNNKWVKKVSHVELVLLHTQLPFLGAASSSSSRHHDANNYRSHLLEISKEKMMVSSVTDSP
jgi:hypothetical protein